MDDKTGYRQSEAARILRLALAKHLDHEEAREVANAIEALIEVVVVTRQPALNPE